MKCKLLLSGDCANFTTIEFDSTEKTLTLLANYAAPPNASWVELFLTQENTDYLIGLSEEEGTGLLYIFDIDHAAQTCKIQSSQPTLGAPGYFVTLRDNSFIALVTYLGGSVALYPISVDGVDRITLKNSARIEIFPDFPYRSISHGPNKGRQRQCHVHQVLEDRRGLLYALDLGSDRVWIYQRDGMSLLETGWLQCPPGTGARHAAIIPNKTLMYVIGELSHEVVAFDLTEAPARNVMPIDGFAANVIPPTIKPQYTSMMDASKICLHPRIPNVLYVSNRWETHIAKRGLHLKDPPEVRQLGDTIAIILLSSDGRKVESIEHIRTNLEVIRGMRLNKDGVYMAVLRQEGGGVEIYSITGEKGDAWVLAASFDTNLEAGLKHAI